MDGDGREEYFKGRREILLLLGKGYLQAMGKEQEKREKKMM